MPQPGHYHKECVKETQVPHTVLLVFLGSQRYRKGRTKATKSTPEMRYIVLHRLRNDEQHMFVNKYVGLGVWLKNTS